MKKIKTRIISLALIALCLFFLNGRINDTLIVVKTGLESIDPSVGLGLSPEVRMTAPGQLTFVAPTFVQKMLVPSEFILTDPLYCIFFIGLCIISLWAGINATPGQPFTRKALFALYGFIGWTCVFLLLNAWRYSWMNKELIKLTHNAYGFTSQIFDTPEFWIFFVLCQMVYFFKRGMTFQQSQFPAVEEKAKKRSVAKEVAELLYKTK